jgi:hypothetical protein
MSMRQLTVEAFEVVGKLLLVSASFCSGTGLNNPGSLFAIFL